MNHVNNDGFLRAVALLRKVGYDPSALTTAAHDWVHYAARRAGVELMRRGCVWTDGRSYH